MPHAEGPGLYVRLVVGRQLQQAQMVGDRGALEPHPAPDLLLAGTGLGQRLQCVGEFHGVQIVALHVLDQRQLEAVARVEVRNHCGHAVEARRTTGAPAPLTDHQLVALTHPAHHHGLQHAVHADRGRKALELGSIEDAPGLIGVRVNGVDGDLPGRRCRGGLGGIPGRAGCGRRPGTRQQRAQASTERVARITHVALPPVPAGWALALQRPRGRQPLARPATPPVPPRPGSDTRRRPSSARRRGSPACRGSAPR